MSGPAIAPPGAGPDFSSLLPLRPAAAAINHLLRSAAWARKRLSPHAGKIARFDLAPFSLALTVLPSGQVAETPRANPSDVRFTLTPSVAMRMLASRASAWQEVRVDGDTALARDVLHVAQNLRWDAEEDLSRIFGDIVAHRMARAGAEWQRWQRGAAERLGHSAVAYLTEERPLVAARSQIERFNREIDALRDDVARLEKRLQRLTAKRERRQTRGESR
jgi:ubiquinone biosynthesis protein UbiJ